MTKATLGCPLQRPKSSAMKVYSKKKLKNPAVVVPGAKGGKEGRTGMLFGGGDRDTKKKWQAYIGGQKSVSVVTLGILGQAATRKNGFCLNL